jgi:2'-5' RNA ligase
MVPTEPASGVVIRIPVPAGLERLRRRWDVSAAVGVPAHVTVLFPFVPVSRLTPAVRADLASIAGSMEPFEIAFPRVGRFPTVVYLEPAPAAPISALTAAIVARYPAFPPYGGAFDVVIPHLTVTETADGAPLDEIAADAGRWLPFSHRATALELLVESSEGRWRRHWRLPLGVRR